MKTFPKWIAPLFVLGMIAVAVMSIQKFGEQSLIYATGSVQLTPNLEGEAKGIRTVFITLFDAEFPGGMPYGAIKYEISDDPREKILEFTLTKDNLRVMNPNTPIPKNFRIKARLDRTGQGGADKPGDITGELADISLGAKGVTIVADHLVF